MPVARRPLRLILATVVALAAALAGYAGHLGYWGGSPYRWVPATAPVPPGRVPAAAVFWSGDMGFNTGMGPRIAAGLAARGVPVLGVNSLTAFASRRTPAEARALVRDAAERALARSGASRLLLIGQSFGANALIEGAAGLPPALRRRVAAAILVVPGRTRLLRATPGGVLDFRDDGPALPAARRLDWAPTLCIRGETEADSLCPEWHARNVRATVLPGDHYLRHDDAAVVRAALGFAAPYLSANSSAGRTPATPAR